MKDDLIKRGEAEKAVCAGCLTENGVCVHHWDCPMLTNLVKLSSADRLQGKWIYNSALYASGNPHYDCSCCGESVEERTNFCSNCGAEMKE